MQGRLVPPRHEDRVGIGLRHACRRQRQLLHESENRPQPAVDGSCRKVLDQTVDRLRRDPEQFRRGAVAAVAVWQELSDDTYAPISSLWAGVSGDGPRRIASETRAQCEEISGWAVNTCLVVASVGIEKKISIFHLVERRRGSIYPVSCR